MLSICRRLTSTIGGAGKWGPILPPRHLCKVTLQQAAEQGAEARWQTHKPLDWISQALSKGSSPPHNPHLGKHPVTEVSTWLWVSHPDLLLKSTIPVCKLKPIIFLMGKKNWSHSQPSDTTVSNSPQSRYRGLENVSVCWKVRLLVLTDRIDEGLSINTGVLHGCLPGSVGGLCLSGKNC